MCIATAAALAGGCGGASIEQDEQAARAALLTVGQLPAGSRPDRTPFGRNDCNPRRRFAERTEAVAEAPLFAIGSLAFAHAAGIFETDETADEAFADFTSQTNDQCTLAEMHQMVREETGEPGRGRVERLPGPAGSERRRYSIVTSRRERFYFDTTAARNGRAIVVVGILRRDKPAAESSRAHLTQLATRELARALDSP